MALGLQQLISLLVVAKPPRSDYALRPYRVPTLRPANFRCALVVFIARQER